MCQFLLVFGIQSGQEIFFQIQALLPRRHVPASYLFPRSRCVDLLDFKALQLRVINLEFINPALVESSVPEPLANGDIVPPTSSDIFHEVITNLNRRRLFPIDIDGQSSRLGRTIVGDGHLNPLVYRHGVLGSD